MAKRTPFRLVAIVWADANGAHPRDGTFVPGDHAPVIMTTVGWLLCKDAKGVSLANERHEDGSFRGQTFIPAAMVKKIRTIPTEVV